MSFRTIFNLPQVRLGDFRIRPLIFISTTFPKTLDTFVDWRERFQLRKLWGKGIRIARAPICGIFAVERPKKRKRETD
jgi:hypothetical protein